MFKPTAVPPVALTTAVAQRRLNMALALMEQRGAFPINSRTTTGATRAGKAS